MTDKIKKYLPGFNRSATVAAFLFTVIEVGRWLVDVYIQDPELAGILKAGILSVGVSLGVIRRPPPPAP